MSLKDSEAAVPSRVLSIQSSVVYGHVGNRAAVFPMQLLGLDVDPINSCQLSNHTGYKVFTGGKTKGEELAALLDGMEQNGFLSQYSDVLTGYMASTAFLEQAVIGIQRLRKLNPSLFYVCDPVLGDEGKLYVPEAFVAVYRDQLLPLASVITPNQTEATFLTGQKITSVADAFAACRWFHQERGVSTVVITSISLDKEFIDVVASTVAFEGSSSTSCSSKPEETLETKLGSTSTASAPVAAAVVDAAASPSRYHFRVPRINVFYSGTGDLTAALLLVWLKRDRNLKTALEKTLSSVQAVLKRTFAAGKSEIQLVQSKTDIESPKLTVRGQCVSKDGARLEPAGAGSATAASASHVVASASSNGVTAVS